MELSTRKYMIFNVSEVDSVDFEQVLETSADTLRISIDGTKTFVKWDGDLVPLSVSGLTTKLGPYTDTEIRAILSNSSWSDPVNLVIPV